MQLRLSGDRRATKAWIRSRIRHYAELVSLGFVPAVEFGPVENGRAEWNGETRTVRVDIDEAYCRHDADDSAAHEVCHARWPSLPCSGKTSAPRFRRRVLAMRMGVRCEAKGRALPEGYR